MNVLHMASFQVDYPGNFGNMLISYAKYASEKNFESTFLFPIKKNWHSEILRKGGNVVYLEIEPYSFKLSHVKRLQKIVRKFNIHLIHTHFGREHYLLAAILKILNPKLKIVHDWRGHPARATMLKKLIGTIFYRVFNDYLFDGHISNSIFITKMMYEFKLISRAKIFTLHNAINVELFSKGYQWEVRKILDRFGISDKFIILMVRNFRKAVDFNIIIDTMVQLKKQQDVILIWIGWGETEKEIKTRIRKKKLDNIVFAGKIRNTIPFYHAADLAINAYEPYCNETINNSVYEALACKTPVVGLNFGALPLVFNSNQGVCCVELDPLKYAQMILKIKDNFEHYKKQAEVGKKKIFDEFSLDMYVTKLAYIYQNLR